MSWIISKQILAVATDIPDVSAITGRLARCGLSVAHAVEAMNVLTVLPYHPDIMVIHVRHGREMRAYYAARVAKLYRIPFVLILPDITLPEVYALIHLLPTRRAIEEICDDDSLKDLILTMLNENSDETSFPA